MPKAAPLVMSQVPDIKNPPPLVNISTAQEKQDENEPNPDTAPNEIKDADDAKENKDMQINTNPPEVTDPALADLISIDSELTTHQLRTRILIFTGETQIPLTDAFLTGIGVLSDVPIAHGQVGEPLIKNNFFKEVFLQQTP